MVGGGSLTSGQLVTFMELWALWTLNVKNSVLPSHEQYSHGHSNKMMSILQMKSINLDFNYPELKRMTASIRMIILTLVLVMLEM